MPTPADFAAKKCFVNVKNDGNKCFLYSVAAGKLYDIVKNSRYLPKHYKERMHGYNTEGLSLPVPINQIHIFEKNNPKFSVNVIYFEYNKDARPDITPLYVSKYRDRECHVNLLLLHHPDQNKFPLCLCIGHITSGGRQDRT
jgi:hypothetical protein